MNHSCRADVVGSILRPAYLRQARADLDAGDITLHDFKVIEDRAVDGAIAMQEGVGLDVITDGEMRRFMFMGPLSEAVEGIEPVDDQPMVWFDGEGNQVVWHNPVGVTGKLRRLRSVVAEEYTYARSRARKPVKVTVPSPMMLFSFWSPARCADIYPGGAFEMFADAVDVVRAEVEELARLGCQNIQVDAPELATLVDPRTRDWYTERGMEPERMLTEGIDMIDAVVAGIPGVHFGLHVCRGNNEGMWMAEGGYDYIAEAIFRRAKGYHSYVLEYDDERAGDFAPLAQVPDDKRVVLGLVSTKTPTLESVEDLASRIEDATRYVDRERLAITSQCGFGTTMLSAPMTEQEQEAKLRRIAETAEQVWGR